MDALRELTSHRVNKDQIAGQNLRPINDLHKKDGLFAWCTEDSGIPVRMELRQATHSLIAAISCLMPTQPELQNCPRRRCFTLGSWCRSLPVEKYQHPRKVFLILPPATTEIKCSTRSQPDFVSHMTNHEAALRICSRRREEILTKAYRYRRGKWRWKTRANQWTPKWQ